MDPLSTLTRPATSPSLDVLPEGLKVTTSYPLSTSALTRWEPMNPVPPITIYDITYPDECSPSISVY
jgi:hypothetical protein